jgi:hypothetical protein
MTLRKNKISRKRASSNRAKKTKKQVGGGAIFGNPYVGVPQRYAMLARVQAGRKAEYLKQRGAYGNPMGSLAKDAKRAEQQSVQPPRHRPH